MDERRFEMLVAAAIRVHTTGKAKVQTFERAGVLSNTRGLVVKVDGKTYHVMIDEIP